MDRRPECHYFLPSSTVKPGTAAFGTIDFGDWAFSSCARDRWNFAYCVLFLKFSKNSEGLTHLRLCPMRNAQITIIMYVATTTKNASKAPIRFRQRGRVKVSPAWKCDLSQWNHWLSNPIQRLDVISRSLCVMNHCGWVITSKERSDRHQTFVVRSKQNAHYEHPANTAHWMWTLWSLLPINVHQNSGADHCSEENCWSRQISWAENNQPQRPINSCM